MKIWILKITLLLAAGIVYVMGQYYRGPWFENFSVNACRYGVDAQGMFCNSPFVDTGLALIAAGQIFAIAGLILLFANKEGLRKWLWMSAAYLPLGALIVLNIPTESHAWAISLTPSREHATWLLGYPYILLTLGIVLWGWWRGQERSTT